MLELLNSLTWEAVFTIFGSLIAFIVGITAIAKTLNNKPASPPPVTTTPDSALASLRKEELDQLHSRISAAKDVAMENKGEVRVLTNLVKTMEKQIQEHDRRDIEDFKVMQQKIDKVMDIVIQILQDEKL